MKEFCSQHGNPIERICLHADCSDRALCLLCEHLHGSPFQSIMRKTTQSQRTFQNILNQAVDRYLLQESTSQQHQLVLEQISLLRKYFGNIKAQMRQFLDNVEQKAVGMLRSEEQANWNIIKRARIENSYLKLPQSLFTLLMQVYQGVPFQQVFKKNQNSKAEEAYHYVMALHKPLGALAEDKQYRLRTKVPDIRRVQLKQAKASAVTEENYDLEMPKVKYAVRLVKESRVEFDSIVSDCQRMGDMFLTTSYDKKLRVLDNNLQVRGEHEFTNILARVHPIGEDVFACALSKELLIQHITFDQSLHVQNIMRLRGHLERISDIHSLNTRILASSSVEGVKLWDLYKEKCEYTLRQESSPTAIRFLPNNTLLVGYDNHTLTAHSVETMKAIRKYKLKGVPLLIDQGKFTEHQFYLAGFPSSLCIIDTRLSSIAVEINLGQGAVTALADSIYDQQLVATGDRDGSCNLVDLRTHKSKTSWLAHGAKSSISKPRGIVAIFEREEDAWVTVGCNDRNLKWWSIEKVQKPF